MGTGTGSFGPATIFSVAPGIEPQDIAIGDFDGNGELDLATANNEPDISSDDVSILLGTGTGSFGPATIFSVAPGIEPRQIALGDFDGNGELDLATANSGSDDVSILLGTGTGSFDPATIFSVSPGVTPNGIALADFDGDGELDLATANLVSDDVSILLGTGTGSFGPATTFSVSPGSGPISIAVGNFN